MTHIELSLACYPYDHVEAIIDGRVKPPGIHLNFVPVHSYETSRRMYEHEEFDVSETSMATYLTAKSQEKPFIAIPVFTFRRFRHGMIFINTESGIEKPRDLIGKKVGVWVFQMTAAVWVRGILQHLYGVPLEKIEWFAQKPDFVPFERKLKVESAPEGKSLDQMLINGEIDALIAFSPTQLMKKSTRVRRLFPDFQKEEKEYFKKSDIFPIMHTIVMRQRIYERYPWAAVSLLKAFQESKELAYEATRPISDYATEGGLDETRSSLAWQSKYVEEEREAFNGDPSPYNLKDNYKAIQALVQYCYEQGQTSRLLTVEELFTENTRDTA